MYVCCEIQIKVKAKSYLFKLYRFLYFNDMSLFLGAELLNNSVCHDVLNYSLKIYLTNFGTLFSKFTAALVAFESGHIFGPLRILYLLIR